MRTVTIRRLPYLVVPEISRCEGCAFDNNPCQITIKDMERIYREYKCGNEPVIYIQRHLAAVRQYRIDRVVRRLEGKV